MRIWLKWPIVASGSALRRSWSVGLVGMADESASHSAHLLLLICVLRLVESAHGEAPEIFHDERDALRAHQVQTETKAVSFSVCCRKLCDEIHRLLIL